MFISPKIMLHSTTPTVEFNLSSLKVHQVLWAEDTSFNWQDTVYIIIVTAAYIRMCIHVGPALKKKEQFPCKGVLL